MCVYIYIYSNISGGPCFQYPGLFKVEILFEVCSEHRIMDFQVSEKNPFSCMVKDASDSKL